MNTLASLMIAAAVAFSTIAAPTSALADGTVITGRASWYGPGFHGKITSSSEIFDENGFTAAHRTLPFGTRLRVTNVSNGKTVTVTVNDRGPFHGKRVIDLSKAAALAIDMIDAGTAQIIAERI